MVRCNCLITKNQRSLACPYYTLCSPIIPWDRLWPRVWKMIPQPQTNGRLLVALDDYLNPKTGKKIFGCARMFDHAAKQNQSRYPWAQNVVAIGLLKVIKGRWAYSGPQKLDSSFKLFLLFGR